MVRQLFWGLESSFCIRFVLGCIVGVAGACCTSICNGQVATDEAVSAESTIDAEGKVLRHAVFFKFQPTASKEDIARVVESFRALPGKIPQISELKSGENISRFEGEERFTHCFLLSFDDEAGRAAYLPHADHKAFGASLGPHLAGVFVIDYWGRPQSADLEKELKHALFLKFKEETSADDVKKVEAGLAGLPDKIDAIKAFESGTNNSPETHDQDFTHCFMFTFDSEEGLKEYADHPAHREVAGQLLPLMEKLRVIDFWAEGVPKPQVR